MSRVRVSGESPRNYAVLRKKDGFFVAIMDDVLTLLVHLSYLAFDDNTQGVYIPNEEIMDEFKNTHRRAGKNLSFKFVCIEQPQKSLLVCVLR